MEIWVQVLLLVVGCLMTLIGTILVMIFKSMKNDFASMTSAIKNEMTEMADSVKELNEKIGVVINDQKWHKNEIDDIKHRLERVEGQ